MSKATEKTATSIQDELQELREQFNAMVREEEEQLSAESKLDKQVEKFAELYKDPFDEHDVLRIKANLPPTDDAPEGWRLGWKSPRVRETRGMRGWIPCKWDDPVFNGPKGESLLDRYTNLGADNLSGADRTDSIIRVKDLMLCRIDARISKARAYKHIVEAHRLRKLSGQASPAGADTPISSTIGVGMETDHPGKQLQQLMGERVTVPDSKFSQVNKE